MMQVHCGVTELSLRAITHNTCYGCAHTTVTGEDVYWCCIGATLNMHVRIALLRVIPKV